VSVWLLAPKPAGGGGGAPPPAPFRPGRQVRYKGA
jgi:hypothetical protein